MTVKKSTCCTQPLKVSENMYVNRLEDTKGSCPVWRPVIQISWQVLQLASKATSFPVQCPQPGTEWMAWWFALHRGQQPLFVFAVDSVGMGWDLETLSTLILCNSNRTLLAKNTKELQPQQSILIIVLSPPELCASVCTHVHGCPRKLSAIFS